MGEGWGPAICLEETANPPMAVLAQQCSLSAGRHLKARRLPGSWAVGEGCAALQGDTDVAQPGSEQLG